MSAKYHWLVAGQVITTDAKGIERSKNLNVLHHTKKNLFTHNDIGRSQQALQMRFMTQCPQIEGAKITDVFLLGVSPLGHMTTEVFLGETSVKENQDQKRLELN